MNHIKERRSLTTEDYDYIYQEVLGTELSGVLEAKVQESEGNSKKMDSLIEKAALKNKLSTEHMRTIVNKFLK